MSVVDKTKSTAEILSFVADKDLTPQKNLDALIKYAKFDLAKVFPDKDWDNDKWIVGTKPNGISQKIAFVRFERGKAVKQRKGIPIVGKVISQPFRDFAKAFLVVMQPKRSNKKQEPRLTGLKFLEMAQIELQGKADVISINAAVFNHAVTVVESFGRNAATVAVQFKAIKDFLNEYHLTGAHISWEHGLKTTRKNISVGEDRIQYEKERLPPVELFEYMPLLINDIKNDPKKHSHDVLPVYFFMLLSCSPARAHELCYNLPLDCLHKSDNGMSYLRWFPAKGGKPVLKYVHPKMEGWVDEIHDTLKKYTDEGRKIARWYEKKPTSLYLPDDLQNLRAKELVSMKEAMDITGCKKKQWNHIISMTGIRAVTSKGQPGYYRFAEIEKELLKYKPLPKDFPYRNPEMKLKFSEALLTICQNDMNTFHHSIPYMFEGVDYHQIASRFASKHKHLNIFSRHGYYMSDGSPIVVRLHSPRHLIEAIKHWKGVDDKERAQQAGRKNVKQNVYYEHMTGNDLIEMSGEDGVVGPITASVKHAKNTPINFEEVRAIANHRLHLTEYGLCAHDFTQSPCGKFGDHLLCSEQWYVKGAMPEKERRLKRTLEETERLLDHSIGVDEDGLPEYDHWAENHSLKAERLKSLIGLLEDPNVPDGSLIHLNENEEFSISSRALDHRFLLNRKGNDKELLEAVKQIREGVNEAIQMVEKEEHKPELLAPFLELIDESEFD